MQVQQLLELQDQLTLGVQVAWVVLKMKLTPQEKDTRECKWLQGPIPKMENGHLLTGILKMDKTCIRQVKYKIKQRKYN